MGFEGIVGVTIGCGGTAIDDLSEGMDGVAGLWGCEN